VPGPEKVPVVGWGGGSTEPDPPWSALLVLRMRDPQPQLQFTEIAKVSLSGN
jgi:hypothetical protein